jgi:hypothetical protein
MTDSNFDYYPIREDPITRGVANQGKLGPLAGAGDGHNCANAAQKGCKYGVDGKAQTHWFRADVHR